MATVPFSIPQTPLAAGRNVIYRDGIGGSQSFVLAANWQTFLVDFWPGGVWQHQTPENRVEYRVEREDGNNNWVLWGGVVSEEGLIGKGGAANNITLYRTGRAEQARIVIVCDQPISDGVSITGTMVD